MTTDPEPPTATAGGPTAPRGAATARAVAFVASRRPDAEALGVRLADDVGDPEAFTDALRASLRTLADPDYVAGQHGVAPGLGPTIGVRAPLLAALHRGFRRATRQDPPSVLLFLADRLFRAPELECRWFAVTILERTLEAEPERTWQLLRRAAREAADWITVDGLAHPYAAGIAAEPYRWAELEQLVYSRSRWERRLVGSTIATMTHRHGRAGRGPDVVTNALPLLDQLIGDAEPEVQKALAWAYRSLAAIDASATADALRRHADRAAREDDGHRAWVVRDSLSKLDPASAAELRARLAGVRKRSAAPATSAAAETVARFGELPDPATHPEPPLT